MQLELQRQCRVAALAFSVMLICACWGTNPVWAKTKASHTNIPSRIRQMIESGRIRNQDLLNFLTKRYGLDVPRANSSAGSRSQGQAKMLTGKTSINSGLRLSSTHPGTPSQSLNTNFWIPNRAVNSILVDDPHDRVYIGGNFNYIGPFTGPLGKVDAATGNRDSNFPILTLSGSSGYVNALVPDGSGGFYVGGNFDHIGTAAVNNLAHIRSDGTVVSPFNPDPDDEVESIAFCGSNLIVGGFFSTIGGGSRQYIAEIDTTTGSLVSSWTPPAIGGWSPNFVTNVFVYGNKIYFSGYFTTVGDSTRDGIAALDADSGSVTAWNPNPGDASPINYYASFAAANGSVYAGGENTTSEFPLLYKIDTTYGNQDETWDPQIQLVNNDFGYIDQIKMIGGRLCVSGEFSGFGSTTQYGFAALDPVTAALTSWTAGVDSATEVTTFDVYGNEIFFGGYFSSIGGQQRSFVAASDTNGNLLSWSPNTDEAPYEMSYSNGYVYVGGNNYSLNGAARNCVASFVESTGSLTDFTVGLDQANDQVLALELNDTTLYVGGAFRNADGQPRNSLAAFSTNTGSLLPLDAQLEGAPWTFEYDDYGAVPFVNALKVYGGKLYVGGMFDASGDSTRDDAAAFDLSTGELAQWNPNILGRGGYLPEVSQPAVYALAAGGGKIYAGGEFDSVQGVIRISLIAVDTAAGDLTSWNPDLDNGSNRVDVFSLALDGSDLYFGGAFNSVLGNSISNAAAVDTSGNLLPWDPSPDGEVESVAIGGSVAYLGGWFDNPYSRVAAFDKTSGSTLSWNLDLDDFVQSLAVSQGQQLVYLGGNFQSVLGGYSPYFAAVTCPSDVSLPVQATDFVATSDVGSVTLSWSTKSEVANAGFNVLRQQLGVSGWQLAGSHTTDKSLQGLGTSSSGRTYSFTDDKVVSGETYNYKIQSVSTNGSTKDLSTITITVDVPKNYALYQNYPNPFNPTTTIRFDLRETSTVTIELYNTLGQEVENWSYGAMQAGRYNEVIDMSKYASGVYYYRFNAVGGNGQRFVSVKKLVLMK